MTLTQTVQADFSGTAFGGSPTWTDITSYLMTSPQEPDSAPVQITWGRQDWFSTVSPTQFSFTLRNIDGRFTPGRSVLADGITANPLYPHVGYGVRVQVIETVGTTVVNMADGYITDITAIPRNGMFWTVQVNCTDISGRFGTTTPLRGWVVEEMMLDTPQCLYPLQEPETSTTFADLTGNLDPLTFTDSSFGPGFGDAGQQPSGDGLLNAVSVELTNLAYYGVDTGSPQATWLQSSGAPPVLSAPWSVEFWAQTPTAFPRPADDATMLGLDDPASAVTNLQIFLGGLNHVNVVITDSGGTQLVALNGGHRFLDGDVHHFVVTCASDDETINVYADGANVASGVSGSPIGSIGTTGALTLGVLADGPGSHVHGVFSGGFAFLATYPVELSAGRVAAHFAAGNVAFAGESTDSNIARLLSYRPNTGSALDVGVNNVGASDCTGTTQLDAILSTTAAEGGISYINGAGELVFRNNTNVNSSTPVLTLDASLGQVDVPTTWRDDIQNVTNVVTVSRDGGADQTVSDPTSITANGYIATSLTANTDTDAAALALASQALARGIVDQLTIPTLTVDLWVLNNLGYTALAAQVLQLAPGDCVEVVNVPGVPPDAATVFQVQGGSYARTSESASVALVTVPAP